jgi:hypothetical protein
MLADAFCDLVKKIIFNQSEETPGKSLKEYGAVTEKRDE